MGQETIHGALALFDNSQELYTRTIRFRIMFNNHMHDSTLQHANSLLLKNVCSSPGKCATANLGPPPRIRHLHKCHPPHPRQSVSGHEMLIQTLPSQVL